MDAKEIFKKGLTSFIMRKELTQQEVGDILGCSNQNVNRILAGKNSITYENLLKLLSSGMRLEEAFGDDIAAVIRSGEPDAVVEGERLSPDQIVLEGLRVLSEKSPDELGKLIRELK